MRIMLKATAVAALVWMQFGVGLAADPDAGLKEWSLVGKFAAVRTVYISPAGLKDKAFVAAILQQVVSKHGTPGPIQIMIFNDKRHTPSLLPMTDVQMLHQRVQYNRNPNTGFEEFVWISIRNAKTSPPDMKHTKANIKPAKAE